MNQFLPRGYQISPDKRIRKLIADGEYWQIYLTNMDSYALAVQPELYKQWVRDYSLPEGLFADTVSGDYKVLTSNSNYLISSMEKGPFPENNGQVEAFSIAFKTALDLYSNVNFHDAIYIEEYSLLLPTSFEGPIEDAAFVYGKWITGGIGISIDSFDRVSKIMSWLPKETLRESALLAGFSIPELNDDLEDNADSSAQKIEAPKSQTPIEKASSVKDAFHLIGRPELEQFFLDNIIDIVLHQEQYKRMGIAFPGATILYGPPGCGKTYAVERLSEYLGWQRFDIDSSTIASSFIHDTSKKISEVFQAAIKAAPSIIVIDEMEAFLSDRGMAGPTGTHHVEEVAEFLRRIPEAISKGVLIFAMTNMLDAIDSAVLRRGRFDHIIEVKMANAEEIEALLDYRFKELPIDNSVQTKKIASALDGHPMSDVTFVLKEAGRFAVKRNLVSMTQECFDDALNLLPKKKERPKIGFVND